MPSSPSVRGSSSIAGSAGSCRPAVFMATASALLVTAVFALYLTRLSGDAAPDGDDSRLTMWSPPRRAAMAPAAGEGGPAAGGAEQTLRSRSIRGSVGDGGSRAGGFVGAATAEPRPASTSSASLEAAPEGDRQSTGLSISGLAELEGTTRTGEGAPVAACRVQLTTKASAQSLTAYSDHEGRFRFGDLEPRAGYRLRVTPPVGFEEEVVALALKPGQRHVDVTLREEGAGRLHLTVVGTDGEPVSNRILTARSAAGPIRARGVTDAEGRLVLESVPAGGLVIESPAAPRMTVSGLTLSPAETVDVAITAALGEGSVGGLTTDAEDSPLVGVAVTATWGRRDGGVHTSVVHTVRTDGTGRFVFHGLGPGSFEISAVAAGYQRARARIEVPSDREVRLSLPSMRQRGSAVAR